MGDTERILSTKSCVTETIIVRNACCTSYSRMYEEQQGFAYDCIIKFSASATFYWLGLRIRKLKYSY
jgi:hypothetical protein